MTEQPKVRKQKLGDKKSMFDDKDVSVYEIVMSYGAEIQAAVEQHSPVLLRADRLTKLDYLISLKTCAEKTLNKGLLKNFRKDLNGVTIGAGSRRMLVAKLGKLFASKAYALYPVSRFFCPADAYQFQLKKKRDNLKFISMSTRQIEKAVVVRNRSISTVGARYYDEGAPLIKFEPLEADAEPQTKIVEQNIDAGFDRQSQEISA